MVLQYALQPWHADMGIGLSHTTMVTSVDTPTALCGLQSVRRRGMLVCLQPGGCEDLPTPVMLLIVLWVHAL